LEDQETDDDIAFKCRGKILLYGYYMLQDYMAEKYFKGLEDKSHTTNDSVM
jgi:hypothetical protein